MSDIPAIAEQLRGIENEIGGLQEKQKNFQRAIWGAPDMGQKGLHKEMLEKLSELDQDIGRLRDKAQSLADKLEERVTELEQKDQNREAESRGMKRAISYTGLTNIVTIVTVIGSIVAIWSAFN